MQRFWITLILILPLIWPITPIYAQVSEIAELTIGFSTDGRPITALRIGNGPRKLVLVGDTHGYPEINTYYLADGLADYFRANPQRVPPSVRLYIIPTLNPDGIARVTRFNATGVDLNRNMNTNLDACPENDWNTRVFGARGLISDTGGPYADSEIESRLIRSFLLDASAAIFYHSNAGSVFPAFCEHAPSIRLAEFYAAAANYEYTRYWANYPITGGMHDWAASLGIAAIIPELISPTDPEFEQNLNAVLMVLDNAETLLPPLADQVEAGQPVPALIWRYWAMHGGAQRFGWPIAPAHTQNGRISQAFERTVLEIHPELADTPYLVQPALLGAAALAAHTATPATLLPGSRFFPETGYALADLFADYWEQSEGQLLFGFPISPPMQQRDPDGQVRVVQYFERALLSNTPQDGSMRMEPLGWQQTVRAQFPNLAATHQIR